MVSGLKSEVWLGKEVSVYVYECVCPCVCVCAHAWSVHVCAACVHVNMRCVTAYTCVRVRELQACTVPVACSVLAGRGQEELLLETARGHRGAGRPSSVRPRQKSAAILTCPPQALCFLSTPCF